MNKKELIDYIDVLHHNRDNYSRAKLLELIKEKINSDALLESQIISENEVKRKNCKWISTCGIRKQNENCHKNKKCYD